MIIFNKYKVNGLLFFLTIYLWVLIFIGGCSPIKTAPWSESEVEKLSDLTTKTVPKTLYEF